MHDHSWCKTKNVCLVASDAAMELVQLFDSAK